ncbi:DUF4831 family protein [Williamwhitmania taraxaci]|uniref:DUF4831 family protein n=1 Tax=Williamwhitmania taraxaci TaxID=1640674 RepID=A0A1G6TDE5_9BACT|nr:DUF4831 family protein [Williamwhitmania taraxaci]SDD27088.1 protein of unknown function [Williamwhitmania taraxaci]
MKLFTKTIFTLVAIAALLSSCMTSKPARINSYNATGNALSPNRFVFYYPKTVLNFRVSCLHERFIPGPYANYSKKYIGVNPLGSVKAESWQIMTVSIMPACAPDYLRLFSVDGTPSEIAKVYRAIGSGSLFSTSSLVEKSSIPFELPEVFRRNDYLDMGVAPFISAKKSVFNTRVQVDSGFVRVPIQKTIVVESSLEDKANEAAEFIFSLRKRRLDLISGEVDHSIDGNAMAVALAEINRLEEAYLSLFVGKVFLDTLDFHYSFVPTSALTQNSILFRFSEEFGALNEDNLSGRPIMLELLSEKSQELLKVLGGNSPNKAVLQFPYLFPEVCRITLTDGKNTLLQRRIPVNQLGQIVFFPVSILE